MRWWFAKQRRKGAFGVIAVENFPFGPSYVTTVAR